MKNTIIAINQDILEEIISSQINNLINLFNNRENKEENKIKNILIIKTNFAYNYLYQIKFTRLQN